MNLLPEKINPAMGTTPMQFRGKNEDFADRIEGACEAMRKRNKKGFPIMVKKSDAELNRLENIAQAYGIKTEILKIYYYGKNSNKGNQLGKRKMPE